jgi:hypothetical protein
MYQSMKSAALQRTTGNFDVAKHEACAIARCQWGSSSWSVQVAGEDASEKTTATPATRDFCRFLRRHQGKRRAAIHQVLTSQKQSAPVD